MLNPPSQDANCLGTLAVNLHHVVMLVHISDMEMAIDTVVIHWKFWSLVFIEDGGFRVTVKKI